MEEFDPFRIEMVYDLAAADIHCLDLCHILVGEIEVENVEVLPHTVYVHRFRNDDDAAPDVPFRVF